MNEYFVKFRRIRKGEQKQLEFELRLAEIVESKGLMDSPKLINVREAYMFRHGGKAREFSYQKGEITLDSESTSVIYGRSQRRSLEGPMQEFFDGAYQEANRIGLWSKIELTDKMVRILENL